MGFNGFRSLRLTGGLAFYGFRALDFWVKVLGCVGLDFCVEGLGVPALGYGLS